MIKELPKTDFIKTKKCDVFVPLKEMIVRMLTQSKCVPKQTTIGVFYFMLPDIYTHNTAIHSACIYTHTHKFYSSFQTTSHKYS